MCQKLLVLNKFIGQRVELSTHNMLSTYVYNSFNWKIDDYNQLILFDNKFEESKTYLNINNIFITNLNDSLFDDVVTVQDNNIKICITNIDNIIISEECNKCSIGLNTYLLEFIKYVNLKAGEFDE